MMIMRIVLRSNNLTIIVMMMLRIVLQFLTYVLTKVGQTVQLGLHVTLQVACSSEQTCVMCMAIMCETTTCKCRCQCYGTASWCILQSC